MTVNEIRERILNRKQDIRDACKECDRNCQVCTYEGKCQDELKSLHTLLQETYCADFNSDCTKCDYVAECSTLNAKQERRRREEQKHKDTCKHLNEDCSKCEYFAFHCSYEKGNKEWFKKLDECCSKEEGCKECPMGTMECFLKKKN